MISFTHKQMFVTSPNNEETRNFVEAYKAEIEKKCDIELEVEETETSIIMYWSRRGVFCSDKKEHESPSCYGCGDREKCDYKISDIPWVDSVQE